MKCKNYLPVTGKNMNRADTEIINLLIELLPNQCVETQLKMLETIDNIVEVSKQSNLDYMIREYKTINWSLQTEVTEEVAMKLVEFIPILERSYEDIIRTNDMYRKVMAASLEKIEKKMIELENKLTA